MQNDEQTEPRVELDKGPERRDSMMQRTIADRYEVISTIGSGGMGTVYLARQRGLNRSVAIKVLQKDLRVDPETVTRFHREAHTMSLLQHPNSVRVFDFGETEDGRLYIVMELLHGRLLTKTSFNDDEDGIVRAARVARQILGALAEAHSKGIVHRDLKPDNIFLAEVEGQVEPVVKVLDFGIVKIVAGDPHIDQFETQQGTVFGTPRYMSPEQAQGKSLDGRSDLYAVGVLLYEMLTGKAPFSDPDAVVVMAKHIREAPASLRETAPDRKIPPELEAVVLRALEKDPPRRFQFAEEFIEAIDASVPDVDQFSRRRRRQSPALGTMAQQPLSTMRLRGLRSRKPLLLAIVAVLTLLLVAWLTLPRFFQGPATSKSTDGSQTQDPSAASVTSPVHPEPKAAPAAPEDAVEPVQAEAPAEAVLPPREREHASDEESSDRPRHRKRASTSAETKEDPYARW